jgi:nicrotizing toxin Mtb-like protein
MKVRRMLVLAADVVLGVGAVSGFAPVAATPGGPLPAAARALAGQPSPGDACSAVYYLAGDGRLGPQTLPATGVLAGILHGYHRLGGMTVAAFLSQYWKASGATGGWIYPPSQGFAVGRNGRPQESVQPVQPGQDIDRFGGEHGTFLSPQGVPFARRALPPQSLDGTPPQACDYHDYAVIRRFRVEAGPAAAWFAQPGHGTQYKLDPTLIPGAPRTLDITWLINHGYLAPVSPFPAATRVLR